MRTAGIYIHIPFCKKKCDYCDFTSFCNKDTLIAEYMKWLNYEIKSVANHLKENNQLFKIDTIYIGGGTPSYIHPLYIQELLNTIKENYSFEKNIEITIEVNPGTITEERLLLYKSSGVNRLSIGLQSTHDKLLNQLGRIHTYHEFLDTYQLARKVGFGNINIDFMIGIPNQTIKDVGITLQEIITLNPEHISMYSLIVEEGTKLSNDILYKKYALPNEDTEREMYWLAKETLEKNDYIHYEISNFAKKGCESKHNLNCWNQKEYFGFGVAAHSYMDSIRFSNIDSIEDYIYNYQNNQPQHNFVFHEKLDYMNKMKEYIMLGFRKLDGVNKSEFEELFKIDIYRICKEEIAVLIEQELIVDCGENIKLTKKGLDIANKVFEKFV